MEKSSAELKAGIIIDFKNALCDLKNGNRLDFYSPYVNGLLSFLYKKDLIGKEIFINQYINYLEINSSPVLKIDDAILFLEKKLFNENTIELIDFYLSNSVEKKMDYDIVRNFIMQLSYSNEHNEKLKMKIKLLLYLLNQFEVNKINKQNIKLIQYLILKINLYPIKNYSCFKEVIKSYWLLVFWIKKFLMNNDLIAIHQNYLTTLINLPSPIKFGWTKKNEKLIDRIFEIVPTEKLKKFIAYTKIKNAIEINKAFPDLFYKITPDKNEFLNAENIIEPFLKNIIVPEVYLKHFGIMRSDEVKLFIYFLKGGRLRDYQKMAVSMDRKASHELRNLKTSDKLEFWEYFFVAQLISEGVTYEFAREVFRNIRGINVDYNFWATTMTLLYKKGLTIRHVNELMDYINDEVFVQNKKIDFKTKKLGNLISDSRKWHNKHKELKVPKKLLRKSFISDFYFKDEETFVIKQLLNTRELFLEGDFLHHCVYTYANSCIFTNRFIFSLRIITEMAENRLITIEVHNKSVVQAKGLYNRLAERKEYEIIKKWAEKNGLHY